MFNRKHDKESAEISARHDLVKAKNKAEREQKEKDRLEKYDKPFQDKKDSHTLQMELHKLIFDIPRHQQTGDNWNTKFNAVKVAMQKMKIWDGFVWKFQMSARGYNIN